MLLSPAKNACSLVSHWKS